MTRNSGLPHWSAAVLMAGLLLSLAVSACQEQADRVEAEPLSSCALGGQFSLGRPQIVSGVCDQHLPSVRSLELIPAGGPKDFEVSYGYFLLRGRANDQCVLHAGPDNTEVDGHPALLAMSLAVQGDRLDGVIDLQLSGLPTGEVCNVRFQLVGRRQQDEQGGNPTGGACEMGISCVHELCVFGGASACSLDVCVFVNDPGGRVSYCTEPCEPGSCPLGFVCTDIGPWIFDATGEWFCVRKQARCGDGIMEGEEVCDDGNNTSGDGCAATCHSREYCGNGVLDAAVKEECDDGDREAGDGCSAWCTVEKCGNHVLDVNETCDDGNDRSGDGCSDGCWLEGCGNGRLDLGEGCDDGNLLESDGCDGRCRSRLVAGASRVAALWMRSLAGGSPAQILAHRAVVTGERAIFSWTERYDGAGPFGSSLETYLSWLASAQDLVRPPMRVPAMAGWMIEDLVTMVNGQVIWLMRQEATFALVRSVAGGEGPLELESLDLPSLPQRLPDNAFGRLLTDGTQLYVALGLVVPGAADSRSLFFSRSGDNGLTWSNVLRLSPNAELSGWASPPLLWAGGAGQVVCLWADRDASGDGIFAARSSDYGFTWIRYNERLGAHGRIDRAETAASLQSGFGEVLAAWSGPGGIFLARWDGQNTPWRTTRISAGEAVGPGLGPVGLAVGQGADVYVAFSVRAGLYVAVSQDTGNTFSAPEHVGNLPAGAEVMEIGPLHMSVDQNAESGSGKRVVLTWLANYHGGEAGGWLPLAIASPDNGEHWSREAAPWPTDQQLATSRMGSWSSVRLGTRELAWADAGVSLWIYDLDQTAVTEPWPSPTSAPGAGCVEAVQDGGWCTPTSVGAPAPRSGAVAVSTGAEIIVFGGSDGFRRLADGGKYDPLLDSWTRIHAGRPGTSLWGRSGHTAVWTGSDMLVFGGHNGLMPLGDGARYDPATDTWSPLPAAGAPSARYGHSATWTGHEMVIFGGRNQDAALASGARYRPANNTWTAMPDGPLGVWDHTAVWTGKDVLIFGGMTDTGAVTNIGLRYDVQPGTLALMPTEFAPGPRAGHSAVWTGSTMLIWSGYDAQGLVAGGGAYDPSANTWVSLSPDRAPSPRLGQVAGWTGTHWLIWGGSADGTGSSFDTYAGAWQLLPTQGAPLPRWGAAAGWAVDRWLIFGGTSDEGKVLADGVLLIP